MSEGRIYTCRWKQERGAWLLWIHRRPKLRARGESHEVALDRLCTKIASMTGDGEPRFVYDPPLPQLPHNQRWVSQEWALLMPEGDAWLENPVGRYFEGGECDDCGRPIGARNAEPLVLTSPPDADVCWPVVGRFGLATFSSLIVSESFLALLSRRERGCFRWMHVRPTPRMRRRFFECIPDKFASWTAVRGWKNKVYECRRCGYRSWTSVSPDATGPWYEQLNRFVAASALPSPGTPAFAIGTHARFCIALPRARALSLVGRAGARGAGPDDLGVVPDSMAGAAPKRRS